MQAYKVSEEMKRRIFVTLVDGQIFRFMISLGSFSMFLWVGLQQHVWIEEQEKSIHKETYVQHACEYLLNLRTKPFLGHSLQRDWGNPLCALGSDESEIFF